MVKSSLSQFPTKNLLQLLEIKEAKEQYLFFLFDFFFVFLTQDLYLLVFSSVT